MVFNTQAEPRMPAFKVDLNFGRNEGELIESVSKMVITNEYLFFIASLEDWTSVLVYYEFSVS